MSESPFARPVIMRGYPLDSEESEAVERALRLVEDERRSRAETPQPSPERPAPEHERPAPEHERPAPEHERPAPEHERGDE